MTNHLTATLTPESLLEHASWARSLARSLVGEAAADDLVQETWVAALGANPDQRAALRPWLGTVLGNFARQGWRSSARRAQREESAAAKEAQPSAAELTERAESQKLLMEQLLELDEDLREVLLLKYFEELSAAEIGRRKGLPASTIKSRLQRGLEQLRVALESRCGGGRESWGLALLPLLRVPRLQAGLAKSGAGLLGWMALAKLALWLWIGTLGALGLALVIRGGLPFMESVPVEPVQFTPLQPVSAAEWVAPDETSQRVAVERPAAGAEAPEPSSLPVPVLGMRVRARFLDQNGAPVSGVQFGKSRGLAGSGPASDASGRLEVSYEPRKGMLDGNLRYFHPFLASDVLSFRVTSGSSFDLGDIRVSPGGALFGRVENGLGEPLEDAAVNVRGAQVARSAGGGMTSYTSTSLGQGQTKTNSAGEFHFKGLLAGDVRVDVDALRGLHKARSGWVEIRAGQESRGLVIIAPAAPLEKRIEGHVFDPDGNPLQGVDVDVRYSSFFKSGRSSFNTLGDSFFRFISSVDSVHKFVFTPPSRFDWAPVVLELNPGQIDLYVQFEPSQSFSLTVLDEQEIELDSYRCIVLDERGENTLQVLERKAPEPGRARLRLPEGAFTLRLDAPGFALHTLHMGRGQLDAGDDLSLSLKRLPGVTGRVTFDGQPLAGANLYLQRRATQKTTYNGFPVRFDGRKITSTTSAADGSFYLDLREAGRYVVRASLDGFAAREVGPLQLSPTGGASDLEFSLTAGGTLQGQLLLDPGMNPAGRVVAITRGDCWAETRRVGPGGVFLFEHLIPGPWLVSEVNGELNDSEHSSTSSFFGSVDDEVPSNCVVVEGQTTRHDLMQSASPLCTLKGQIELVGFDMSSWRGQLGVSSTNAGEVALPSSFALDSHGNFELRIVGEGTHSISFGESDAGGLRFALLLELHEGLNEWEARVELAEVHLLGTLPAPAYYLWQGPKGLQAMQLLSSTDGPEQWLHPLPAGRARLVLVNKQLDPSDLANWPTWSELDLPAGELSEVDVPR